MSTVTFEAACSFCSKKPSSWSMLVATVQNGTSVPSMLIVVSYAERMVTTSWSLSAPFEVDSMMSWDLMVTPRSLSKRSTEEAYVVIVVVCPLMERATVFLAPTVNVHTEASTTAIEQHATLMRRSITVRCGVQRRAMPSPSEIVERVACLAEPLACIVATCLGAAGYSAQLATFSHIRRVRCLRLLGCLGGSWRLWCWGVGMLKCR